MDIPVVGELAFLARNFFGWMVNAPQMNAPDGVSYIVYVGGGDTDRHHNWEYSLGECDDILSMSSHVR